MNLRILLQSIIIFSTLCLSNTQLLAQACSFSGATITVVDTATAGTGGTHTFYTSGSFGNTTPITGTFAACSKGQLTFIFAATTAPSATAYEWSNNGSGVIDVSGTNGTNYTIDINGSGTFNVVLKIDCGNGLTTYATFTVQTTLENPPLSLNGAPTTQCDGDTETLNVTTCTMESSNNGTGSGQGCFETLTYFWDDGNGGTATGTSLPIIGVASLSPETYTIEALNGNGCYTKITHTITVFAYPDVSAISAVDKCANSGQVTEIQSGGACSNCTSPTYGWQIFDPTSAVNPFELASGTNPTFNNTLLTPGAYTAELTVSENGCTTTVTDVFTVNSLPVFTATAGGSTGTVGSECLGAQVTLDMIGTNIAAGAYTSTWTSSSPTNAPVSNPNTSTATATTTPVDVPGGASGDTYTYTLQIEDVNGCTNSDDVIIPFLDTFAFVATIYDDSHTFGGGGTPITSICEGETVVVELTESDADFDFPGNTSNITWTPLNGGPTASLSNGNLMATIGPFNTAGTYFYEVEIDPSGTTCNSVGVVEIVVNATPNVTIATPTQTTYCSGETVTLNGNLNGSNFTSWKEDGIVISAATSATLTTTYDNTTSSIKTVTYTLTGGNANCSDNASIDIDFYPSINVDIPFSGGTECSGTDYTINALPAPGTGNSSPYKYSWNSGALGNASTYTISSPIDGQVTTVSLLVEDNNGCTATDSETFTFEDCGTYTITSNINGNGDRICVGDTLVLTINNTVSASDLSTCEVRLVYYWTTGASGNSCSNTGETIEIPITADMTTPYNLGVYVRRQQYYCHDPTDQVQPPPPTASCTYGHYHSQYVDGQYQIYVPYSFDIIKPSPEVVPTDTVEYCYGDTLSVVPSCPSCIAGVTYDWDNGWSGAGPHELILYGDSTIIVKGTSASCEDSTILNYNVRPQILPTIQQGDQDYFCIGDFINLDAQILGTCANCSVEWSTGQTSNSITTNLPGTYIFQASSDLCTESDTIDIYHYPEVNPLLEDFDGNLVTTSYYPLCGASDSIRVRGTSCPGCSYSWNTGATTPFLNVNSSGGYYVYATDTNGCTGYSDPILATFSLTGQNSLASASPSIRCNGEPFELEVEACAGCTYEWYDYGPDTLVGTDRIYVSTDTGTYYAIVTNIDGCAYESNTVFVDAITLSAPQIVTNTDSICVGTGSATLDVITTPSQVGWQWYKNGLVVSSANDTSYIISDPGDYYVVVTMDNGCELTSNTIQITSATLSPSASAPTSTVCQGSIVTITTPTVPGYTYQWYRNGNLLVGETTSAYDATQSGQYYAMVYAFGCAAQTNIVTLNSAAIGSISALTDKNEICPGDSATLGVTLCAGCSYQWYDAITSQPLTTNSNANYEYVAYTSGKYFVRVTKNNCFTDSDTIDITVLPVILPAINTSSSFVCEGQSAVLSTSGCTDCNYTWLRNNTPIFGALNDTFFIVSSSSDAGSYSVLVEYPNGCSDTSVVEVINDGSYILNIQIDSSAGDSLVCNGSTVVLEIDSLNSSNLTYCNLGCNFQWFRTGLPINPSNSASYSAVQGGFYKLRMVDERGCIEESNLLDVSEVNLNPQIVTNATSICGVGTAELSYPDSSSCIGCTYTWQKGGSPATYGVINTPFYETDTGANAVGTYTLQVEQLGCVALSNQIPLNQIQGLDIPVAATDSNICNGDTVTVYRTLGGCTGCLFQWLLDDSPLLSATTPSLVVNGVPGDYTLEMTVFDTATGNVVCVDTSSVITLDTVPTPILGFDLTGAGITPLTSSGTTVNLYDAVFPSTIHASNVDSFYSQPFDAALPPNSGLETADNSEFNPTTSGAGYHRIYYLYDTLGCNFILDDIMYVFDEPSVDIINENISAPLYEACVSDTLLLNATNLPFKADSVYLLDANNNYVAVAVDTNTLAPDTFGVDVVYNGYIRFGVPAWAQESFMLVTSASNADTFITPFLLIHNENLNIGGLPTTVCSNGDSIQLTGTPLGGFFTAEYTGAAGGSTTAAGTNVTDAFSGAYFHPNAMVDTSYGADQIQQVNIVYNYINTYTNGATCPLTDTVIQPVEARGVFLDSVSYNPIAVSQENEEILNLIYTVFPYSAQPSQWAAIGNTSFFGNFTFPAGAPVDFLPATAGVGMHAMTYTIENGICSNSFTDSIEVIEAPDPINIPDSMCRNQVFAPFAQQLGGIYDPSINLAVGIQPGITIADTANTFVVSTASGTGLTFIPGVPERYTYDPSVVPTNTDTLFVEYWYKKVEYDISGGTPSPIDTIEYVIGSITIPIFIDTVSSVEIIDTLVDSIYCEVNELHLLAGSPSGGFFTLKGGTGAYQAGDTLDFNILNPYAVHNNESSNTDYLLTYVKQGAVCVNTDTMTITIPEPLDPTFAPASGSTFYCASDPVDSMIINTTGGFTSDWLINGVTIDTFPDAFNFNPSILVPGNQAVAHVVLDTLFGCVYTEIDTFVVNPLPIPQVIPELDTSYCTNDPVDTISVTPYPICALNAPNGLTILSQNFDSTSIATPTFPPAGWVEFNNGTGEPWMLTSNSFSLPFAAMVNQSNDVEDAWLFSPTAPFITGHSYQIQMMARANCNNPVGGCDPAQLRITLANAQNFASHVSPSATVIVDTSFTSSAYLLYTFTYVHNGVTGNYSLGFQNYTTNNGRSLFIDDLKVDDLSISGCVQGGVGSMNGPGISYLADSTYTFDPTVVAPGSYVITYTYTDAATGCSDNVDMNVKVKPHPTPVFTNLANQYCDNAPSVLLQGVPAGGTFSSTGPNLVTSPNNVYDPNTGITGEIITYSYTAPNGCSADVSDTVDVVTIQDSMYISNVDPAGYCANADSIIIEVEPYLGPLPGPNGNPWGQNAGDGYFFAQDGLNPDSAYIGNAIFYPDSAVLESGRYGDFVLTYVYTSSGCVDTTRATFTVHALPQLSFDQSVPDSVSLPDSICFNANQVQVRVNNHIITGALGEIEYDSLIGVGPVAGGIFTITDTSGAVLNPGFGQNDLLQPSAYSPGWYGVSYYYTDVNGCSATLVDSFRIDTVPEIYFTGLQPDRIYCENESPSLILVYPPYYPGSGFMQIVNGTDTVTIDSSFYMLDPASLVDLSMTTGNVYNVYYEFEDLNFCRGSATDSFEVRPYPRLNLAGLSPTFCSAPDTLDLQPFVSPQGGIFTDDLATTGIVGDTALALNGPSGPRTITYYYVDPITTCWNDTSKLVTIYNTPALDFDALGGCAGATITFVEDTAVSNLVPGVDSITAITWLYGNGDSTTLSPPQATVIPDQTYTYANEGVYEVSLVVNNQAGCQDTVTNSLTISPYVDNYPYVETFDNGPSGWYQEEDIVVPDSVAIWQWAELTGAEINDPGNYAWVTKAQAPYTYEKSERAWVYSPCFDFTSAWRPMIVLDIWRDFLTDIDGAIMEYYDYGTNSWQRVGEKDKGIHWYQTNFLVARPGNQDSIQYPQGWTGESNGWEKARYRLDEFRGRNFVRFRIAFASDPNTVLEGNEGIAFDSVWIGERSRNVLVEHFSNFYHQSTVNTWDMGQINQNLYDTIFNVTNGRDVSLIQYATPQLGSGTQDDPLISNSQVNFADVFARVGYYGISENSKLRIDGTTRGTGNSEEISQWELEYDMLQFPAFDISIDEFAFAGNTIQVNTTTRAMMDMDSADYALYVAITEDNVNNNGNNEMALLRKFRPDAAGEPFSRAWTIGDSVNYSTSWIYPSNINGGTIPQTRMVCIAFIQNKTTQEVYQVATTRNLSIYSSTDDVADVKEDLDGLNLFPNPASSFFNVSFQNPLSEDYDWKLIDVLGRVLDQGEVRAGATEMQVDTRRLSEGNYFFVLENGKVYTQRQVVIVKRP